MVLDSNNMGRVCVTGGTGYLGSWIVKRLLEDGYFVHTTVRMDPEGKRDISYLTNLPGASERLKVFNADLDKPESFAVAIEGCDGVFHVAHPLDFEEKESEQVKIQRVTTAMEGILQACADSETVKRVVYTSSISAVSFSTTNDSGIIDETCWSDVDHIRKLGSFGGPYIVTKTLAEKVAIECADKLGLDLVTVIPTWTTGPFICPKIPDSVQVAMALILGAEVIYPSIIKTSFIHVDDVARAHIHLLEHPEAKGRYVCSAVEITIDELAQFLSTKYPEFKIPSSDAWKDVKPINVFINISSKKLIESGFKFENGLEEMFDGAIKSCKEKGIL